MPVKNSVKKRITVMMTILITAICIISLVAMVLYSHSLADKTVISHMQILLRNNLESMRRHGRTVHLDDDFIFSRDGANVLILNAEGALLAGQVPASFTQNVPLENGTLRESYGSSGAYFVMDVFYPVSWSDGIWVRVLHEMPDYLNNAGDLIAVAAVAFPFFIVITAFLSYTIIKRALKPLDQIADAADGINDAKDLSRRIGDVGRKDEFSRLAGAFDSLLHRLEVLFESEKRFTADASHELRTPITVIKGACDYGLRYDETIEDARESLEVIQRQTNKMNDIVEQLLRITRLENGLDESSISCVDLGLIIRDSLADADQGEASIVAELPEGIMARVDPTLIMRLSDNLISNAIKYGNSEDPVVSLKLSERDGEVLYSVSDNGDGIEEAELPHIWQRFYRSKSARGSDKVSGTGLGLSFVQQISKAHGGYMSVESRPGEGSCFTLHLPAYPG